MFRKLVRGIIFLFLLSAMAVCFLVYAVWTDKPDNVENGTITQVRTIVEQGVSKDRLLPVETTKTIHDGDFLHVTDGGEGLLDFGDYLRLRLFNDTSVNTESTIRSERAEDIPFFARIRLEVGGFTGELKEKDGQAEFIAPNGARVTVLGTKFWVVYDAERDMLGVGNFDGEVNLMIGANQVDLTPGHYVIVPSGQPPEPEQPMDISLTDFDQTARRLGSPVAAMHAVIDQRAVARSDPIPSESPSSARPTRNTATNTPNPTSIPTRTSTPTPTLACPPTLKMLRAASCRVGPSTDWSLWTTIPEGELMEPLGYAYSEGLWWAVQILDERGMTLPNDLVLNLPVQENYLTCWISDADVEVVGGSGCLSPIPIPPTYTPTPEPGGIYGRVFKDLNYNDRWDNNEGYSNVKVLLEEGECSSSSEYRVETTGSDGGFKFDNLKPGKYCVVVDIQTKCNSFTLPIDSRYHTIEVMPGQVAFAGAIGFANYIC